MLNKFTRLGKPVFGKDEYNGLNRVIESKNREITLMDIEKLLHVG
tara:strand:+ start:755 stop:889 length:135 start_codon:yes stop_codon:yes gene_type:complete